MISIIISFLVIVFGAITYSDTLLAIGIIGLITTIMLSKPTPKEISIKPKYKHKVIQADDSAWENNDIWPYMLNGPMPMQMYSGIRKGGDWKNPPIDLMGNVTSAIDKTYGKGFGNELLSRRVRDFMPFPAYGRKGIIDQVLFGFPLSIQRIINQGKGGKGGDII